MQADSWTSRAYVIGEILISMISLVGAGYMVLMAATPEARTAGVSVISAVTVFWFSRRATEQAANKIQEISNGHLQALSERIDKLAAGK